MQTGQFQLPPNIFKNLIDKQNEQKRDTACKDIEIIVCKNADKKHLNQIDKIIIFFRQKYLKSHDLNRKIAGLEVMPSLINGLKNFPEGTAKFSEPIVRAILESLDDNQNKVRMTALKSLYYIAKTLDDKIISMFYIIFDKLITKVNDLDEVVRNAANFFDKSLQTILTSALNSAEGRQEFDLQRFMTVVKSKLKSMNPGVRQFLIKWIVSLNEIMSIDLLTYLPDLLQDLLFMLGDKQKNLRSSAKQCLGNFQRDMNEKFEEGKLQQYLSEGIINQLVGILVKMARGKHSTHTKLGTLAWFKNIFHYFRLQIEDKSAVRSQKMYFKKIIVERFDEILQPILLLMSDEQEEVRRASQSANDILMLDIQLINKELAINFAKVMPLLKQMLSQKKSTSTSESALRWMKFMLQNYNDKILPQIKEIIEKLVEKLCDSSVKNVKSIIENTAVREQYFQLLIEKMLLLLLDRSRPTKPEQILKKFSLIQEGDKFCKSICTQIVKSIDNKQFIFEIVHYLNILIINEKTMYCMRKKLQEYTQSDYTQTFMVLFQAFKYNPPALTSLCLLAGQYRLAYCVLLTFAEQFQIDEKVMLGFCKLASLLQSPGFLPLRLLILQRRDPYLLQCLTALLMILPQGKIFNMLKNRLQVVKLIGWSQPKQMMGENQVNIEYCLQEYKRCRLAFNKS